MEELQTVSMCDNNKARTEATLESAKAANGNEDNLSLEMIDHCENESLGSPNSDVWKGSDSEDESTKNSPLKEKSTDEQVQEKADTVNDKCGKDTINPENNVKTEASAPASSAEAKSDDAGITKIKEEKEDKSVEVKNECETSEKDGETIEQSSEKKKDTAKESNEKKTDAKTIEIGSEKNSAKSKTIEVDSSTNPTLPFDHNYTELKDPHTEHAGAESDERDPDDDQMDYDNETDDDFDPSLLCPEVSMAVDENPVITNSGAPLPFEASFTSYVDDVTGAKVEFNLTLEEVALRNRTYGENNPIQQTRLHCTACNTHLGSALEAQNNRFVHPMLKVLICKECYHFYTSGEFEKDEDGSELYCRWCGQGGQVLCCSTCECVFCKRCIRTNFGRKKMMEIRDSDNWSCYKCNPAQIITQRVACFEFFEYIRREMARASTLNTPAIWSQDYSTCCLSKKRPAENGVEARRPKKKKVDDPDFNPLELIDLPPEKPTRISMNGFLGPKPSVQLLPRILSQSTDSDVQFIRSIPAPQVVIGTARPPVKVNVGSGGLRSILPHVNRPRFQPPSLMRFSQPNMPPLVSRPSFMTISPQSARQNPTLMKHEWFEKTVRAAARVNSHLSYTLTQLNKAQSQASSIEQLAIVHNKLQEILSSSINSLIQIRKNLRTEFIAGIKTTKMPERKREPINSPPDDDVIFVNAPPVASTSKAMPKLTASPAPPLAPLGQSHLQMISKLAKAALLPKVDVPKGGYLKVKSVKDLQNVPSECITIPDEDVEPLRVAPPEQPKPVEILKQGTINDLLDDSGAKKSVSNEIDTSEMKRLMSASVKVQRDNLKELQKRLANK